MSYAKAPVGGNKERHGTKAESKSIWTSSSTMVVFVRNGSAVTARPPNATASAHTLKTWASGCVSMGDAPGANDGLGTGHQYLGTSMHKYVSRQLETAMLMRRCQSQRAPALSPGITQVDQIRFMMKSTGVCL